MEKELTHHDDLSECDVCGQGHQTEECPELGLSSSKFTPQISRARLTVPHYLNAIELPDGGIGICTLESISNKTQLGPFEAKKTMHDIDRDDLFVLKILTKDGSCISLDASCETHCNWMSLVRVAQTEAERNCMAYQLGISIYFNTTRDLAVGDELKVWYAPQYARKLKKSLAPDGKTKSMLGEILAPHAEGDDTNAADEIMGEDVSASSSQQDLAAGTTQHPEDVAGSYVCKHCGALFVSQFLFAKHIRDHLFPVYDYMDGPPRRGRRPVPLKVGESYSPGITGRGTRGRPRGRGRGRGRPRGRPKMIHVQPGGKRSFPLESDFDDHWDGGETEGNTSGIEDGSPMASLEELMKTSPARRPGRPRKPKLELPLESEAVLVKSDTELVTSSGETDNKELISKDLGSLSSSRPRRSGRAISGFGKLGKWLRYPGEESSDEESPQADRAEAKGGRRKFGMAMAASLRKAAMDEMTSPPLAKSKGIAGLSAATSKQASLPLTPKTRAETSSTSSPANSLAAALKGMDTVLSFTTPIDSPSGNDIMDSPKKYIVVKKGEESTAYAISSSSEILKAASDDVPNEIIEPGEGNNNEISEIDLAMGCNDKSEESNEIAGETETMVTAEKDVSKTEIEDANTSTSEEKPETSSELDGSMGQNTSKAEENDIVASGAEDGPEQQVVVEAQEGMSAEDITQIIELGDGGGPIKISASIGEGGEIVIRRVEEGMEVGEAAEAVILSDGTKGDVEVGTQEEVIDVPQQKNTIADLDGTDALTALVNVAISADKVPDPIAMVAADLYDSQNHEDDCDAFEYKVRYKRPRSNSGQHTETEMADDDEGSRGEAGLGQSSRKRRKKRRPGDDPELEELERRTKVVDGPNGTEEFACGICNKHFTQLKYLKLHLPAHTDRYRCQVCGKRFARNESLLKHTCDDTASLVEQTLDESGRDTFSCRECGRQFSQLSFAVRHASMHRARFSCEKCGRTFLRQELLDEHSCMTTQMEEGVASGEAHHECQICKQSFTSGKYLFRHMAMHTDIYKCEVCGKCYSRKDSLQRHISRCCPELSSEYSVHVCPNCKKTFGTQLGLQNHMLNCGKYQCNTCKVAYFSLKDLSEHDCSGKVINEKASVQFPCKECNKTFASIAYLVRHEASHHGAFKCNICDRVFIRKEELSWHTPVCSTRQKIQQDGHAECATCGETFHEWLAFKEHHMTHTHPYRCDKCNKRFIKIGTLHNHKCEAVGEPGGDPNDQLSCNICHKTFKNERYLSRHLSLHGQPEFTCEFCGKFFTRKDYLNDHQCRLPNGTTVRMVRKKNRLFIKDNMACPVCNKTFSSRSNMMKHMKVHGDKQAECHICHKRFHYENYLKLHIATVHEKQYQLQCNHCGKVLFSKTGLIAHVKQFHADTIKLYPCPKCGKTFRQKGNMKTHLISHTKERAYKCDVCGKAFKYPDQLNRHRLEHTLSQKYACELCDKQFVRTYELRNHMRNYHSGFVYVCGVCHECCAHRHTIIRHYKRKHPEVGNVFEEKPEFLDSLQKPITAATQSRMMLEAGEDMKPTIVRVGLPPRSAGSVGTVAAAGHHQIVVATAAPGSGDGTDEGATAFPGGELILQQATGELVTSGDQAVQQVLEGSGGEQQTVFVLKVINQDPSSTGQEMELTEELKAYVAQLLQQHSAQGGDPITHIQLGDQLVQIQRQHEVDGDEEEDIKFDPHSAELDAVGVVGASSSSESVVGIDATHDGTGLVTAGSGVDGMEGIQVVEMADGQLGRIIHMDESQMLEMAANSNSGGQIFQMEGGQVIQLDHAQLMAMTGEDGQVVVSAADLVAAAQEQQQNEEDVTQAQQQHMENMPHIMVTKKRGSNGEIVVQVEGEEGKMISLEEMVSAQSQGHDAVPASQLINTRDGEVLQIAGPGSDGVGQIVSGVDEGQSDQMVQLLEMNESSSHQLAEAVSGNTEQTPEIMSSGQEQDVPEGIELSQLAEDMMKGDSSMAQAEQDVSGEDMNKITMMQEDGEEIKDNTTEGAGDMKSDGVQQKETQEVGSEMPD